MFTDTLNKVTQGMAAHSTSKPAGVILPYVSYEHLKSNHIASSYEVKIFKYK